MPRLVILTTGMLPATAARPAIQAGTVQSDTVRDALQQEAFDREHAEHQNDAGSAAEAARH